MTNLLRRRSGVAVLAVLFSAGAWADISGTQTLSANARFNFDTGATVTSAGDILFTGTSITFQGNATGFAVPGGGASTFSILTQATLSSFAPLLSSSAITGSSLAANAVIAVKTNGGHYAAFLVNTVSATSLNFKYTTFGVTGGGGGPGAPSISGIVNNFSGILPGLPNYGIAPGTAFALYGSGMSNPTAASADPTAPGGLPLTLAGASISVTVGSTTVHPALYYASPTQINGVLPSSTPVGNGTLTVTYNNVSGTASIQVVASALGLDTYFATGSGLGVATDSNYHVFNYNFSASPGQTIILWGSGLGSDPGDSDTTFAAPGHTITTPLQIYIGGIQATIIYQGGSGYPGLNQINVQIPQSVQPGCGVSIVAVTGSGSTAVTSNTISIPVNSGGGVCNDPVLGINGNQILSQGGTVNTPAQNLGNLSVSESTFAGKTSNAISGIFYHYPASTTTYTGYTYPSVGSCIVIQTVNSTTTTTGTPPTGLDAGTISVQGPGGTQQLTNTSIPGTTGPSGLYSLQPSSAFLPPSFGTFTFTGSGGKDVGPFTASISYSNPLNWTNMNSISTINRSQGVTVNWTGGAPGSYVYIIGSSINLSLSGYASFECYAPVNAGTFTVPPYVLLSLAPTGSGLGSSGSLSLYNFVTPGSFTASGLTTGNLSGGVLFTITPAYQ